MKQTKPVPFSPGSVQHTHRLRLASFALTLTQGSDIRPDAYERRLLSLYVEGFLNIDQVHDRLEQWRISREYLQAAGEQPMP